jgi:hypothetical protein
MSWDKLWQEIGEKSLLHFQEQSQSIDHELRINGFSHNDNAQISRESLSIYAKLIVETLQIKNYSNLWEFGCGTGLFISTVAKMVRASQYGGNDTSSSMIALAKLYHPSGIFSTNSALNSEIPFSDSYIFANSVFQYFPNLDYARGVLKNVILNKPLAFALLDIPHGSFSGQLIERKGNSKFKLFHQKYTPDFFYECFQDKPYSLEIRSQKIDGYEQSQERFNVFGFSVDFLSRN